MAKKKSKTVKRCQKKPKYEKREERRKLKQRESSSSENDVKFGRMDDGASRAYRKLGPSEYERYAKQLARVWWDIPHVERSGLLMETSKYRIRGGPVYSEDNKVLTQGLPPPHYTLKVLKTAYKIYRIRMKKRFLARPTSKSVWLWTDKTREEEPKWAHILDRPLFEQYVLLLQYIRNLASQIAWEKGHKKVISSATPFRLMEKLHPLQHLDFRNAKHYLPQPFIESSDSDTQIKIDREIDRLERALAKKEADDEHLETPTGMIAPDELSSSTESSTSMEGYEREYEEGRSKREGRTSWSLWKEDYAPGEMKLLERQGEVYASYKDPGSEDSIFVDFNDLGDYYHDERHAPGSIFRYFDVNEDSDDEEEENEKARKLKKIGSSLKRLNPEESVPDRNGIGANEARVVHRNIPEASISSRRFSADSKPTPDIVNRNSKPNPGPSHMDDLENGNISEEEENKVGRLPTFLNNSNINHITDEIRTPDGMCIITTNCHGDYIPARLKRVKRVTNYTRISTNSEQILNEEEIETVNNRVTGEIAGGDAFISVTSSNETLKENLTETANSLHSLVMNMSKFLENSNNSLDKIENAVVKMEKIVPNIHLCTWDEMKRHIKIIIKRLPGISARK